MLQASNLRAEQWRERRDSNPRPSCRDCIFPQGQNVLPLIHERPEGAHEGAEGAAADFSAILIGRNGAVQTVVEVPRKPASRLPRIQILSHTLAPGNSLETSLCPVQHPMAVERPPNSRILDK